MGDGSCSMECLCGGDRPLAPVVRRVAYAIANPGDGLEKGTAHRVHEIGMDLFGGRWRAVGRIEGQAAGNRGRRARPMGVHVVIREVVVMVVMHVVRGRAISAD